MYHSGNLYCFQNWEMQKFSVNIFFINLGVKV